MKYSGEWGQPGPDLPEIDCVVIGVNCEKTLERCLSSIFSVDYPPEKLHVIYADGGSTDRSIEMAMKFHGVTVTALTDLHPTPGRGRNAGWRRGANPFVQFLDSDTVLDPGWLKKAVAAMVDPGVGAVFGDRREMHPERSVFNFIGNLEWNGPAGDTDSFGGDVMIRRKALFTTGGYNETLVAGEDPELSRRIAGAGWRIFHIAEPMTRHDLAMTRVKQYYRRAYRSGYAFAAVRGIVSASGDDFWRRELSKIIVKAGGFIALALASLILAASGTGGIAAPILVFMAAIGLLFFPRIFKANKFKRMYGLTDKEARIYAWHCSLVVLPQFMGALRHYFGKASGRPLRNSVRRLATGTTGPRDTPT